MRQRGKNGRNNINMNTSKLRFFSGKNAFEYSMNNENEKCTT